MMNGGSRAVTHDAHARIEHALAAGRSVLTAYAQGTVIGTFLIELPTPRAVRGIALAGFDFVVLDLEHSPFGVDVLGSLVSECHAAGLPVLVRVWSGEPGMIGKALDLGANGVMVPRVGDARVAADIVRAARYAPAGERGVAPLIGHQAAWARDADVGSAVLVIVQIEGAQAVKSAGEIAAVPGVDGIFVGPYDLAQSLGSGRDVEAEAVTAAAEQVAAACADHAMLGIYVDDPAQSRRWSDRGFRLQCVGFDGRMLLDGATQTVNDARGHQP